MKSFIGEDFLIRNAKGLAIYNGYAKGLPIVDYHCHLSPKEIAEDRVFRDVGELMLGHDHYKWRIMRAFGIDEERITGGASYEEKFAAYASALQRAPGNPLYHWTHMELRTYFGITEPLTAANARAVYRQANHTMADGSLSVRHLISSSNVRFIATTDDPADTLEYHARIAADATFPVKVVPTFRPDVICHPARPGYTEYVRRLGASDGTAIANLTDLLAVLSRRMDHFARMGCVSSDHGIAGIPSDAATLQEAGAVFERTLSGIAPSEADSDRFLGFLLGFFAGEFVRRGWAMQLHLSAARNLNAALFERLGPDCGNDSAGGIVDVQSLAGFLERTRRGSGLPKIMLFTLNPAAYPVLSTVAGCFAEGLAGKIQLGPAWWFWDHRDGIEEQLRLFANTGVLGVFNGMLTDSRSFTSYVRHDYFRRIFCSLLGEWVENGEYPDDPLLLGDLVKDVCGENALRYFQSGGVQP